MNIDSKPKTSFVYGNGKNSNNELIFYEYLDEKFSHMLYCAKILMETMTTNFAQEFTKSLIFATKLAEEKKVFENIPITIYAKLIVYGHVNMYGPYNIDIVDVVYKNNDEE